MEKVSRFLKNNYKLIQFFVVNTIFSLLLLIILHFVNILDITLVLEIRFLVLIIVFLFSFLLFLFFENQKKEKVKKHFEKYFKIFLLVGLGFITVWSIFSNIFEDIQILFSIFNYLQPFIIIFTVLSGFFTFYFNHKDIEKNLENEQNDEVKKEEERTKEFAKKFKKINKIPILRNIVRWMYREGWGYSISLILIIIISIAIRAWNLTSLDPYTDEYIHLEAAHEFLKKGILTYSRAPIVSYFVILFQKIGNASTFYEYLYWGRIPGIIFGSFTAIPIYLLARKIKKPIAIISVILWSISPWAIGVSRTIREYAYYPFFILITCYAFINLMDNILNYKKEKLKKIIFEVIYIATFLVYVLLIDTLSTLRISLLLLLIILFYKVFIYIKQHKNILLPIKTRLIPLGLALIFVIIFTIWYVLSQGHINLQITQPNMIWLNYLFSTTGTPMQWWHSNPLTILPQLLLGFGIIHNYFKKDKIYLLYLIIFIISTLFYIYFFDRYNRPRYIFYLLPFLTILIAHSVYSLYSTVKKLKDIKNRYIALIIFALFIIVTFNYKNTWYAMSLNQHGYVATTGEYHDNIKIAMKFLGKEIKEDDVIITTVFASPLKIIHGINNEDLFGYDYQDESRFNYIEEIMKDYPNGLILLDSRRNGHFSKGLPHQGEFTIGEKHVKVLKNFDNLQIYRWMDK
jgi:hypothetical protein